MTTLGPIDLVLSFVFTWAVGLAPPILLRYKLIKGPMEPGPAIGTAAVLYLSNLFLFIALGSESKSHAVLFLVAWISYKVLVRPLSSKEIATAISERQTADTQPAQPRLDGAMKTAVWGSIFGAVCGVILVLAEDGEWFLIPLISCLASVGALALRWLWLYPHLGWRRLAMVAGPVAFVGFFAFRTLLDGEDFDDGDVWLQTVSVAVIFPFIVLGSREAWAWVAAGFGQHK